MVKFRLSFLGDDSNWHSSGRGFVYCLPRALQISRQSIDALKDWFRDEMQKSDWQLIVELKKVFEII